MSETSVKYIHIPDENQEKAIRVIKWLIANRRFPWLEKIVSSIHPGVLTNLWDGFNESEQSLIINSLDIETAAEVISELNPKERGEIFKKKDTSWIVDRLEELESDDVVDILKGLPEKEASFILRKFDKDYSKKVKSLIHYEEETAGALMSSDFIAVNASATVDKITRQFQKQAETDDLQDLHFIYVTNNKNQLAGYIPIRKLITEKTQKKASEIMSEPSVLIDPYMDQEEVAKIFKDYDLISIPVVNKDNVILGRITIDDVVDVLEEEASEDVFKMFGLNKKEKSSNGVMLSLRHRLPWMLINLCTTAISAFVISLFAVTLKKFVILAMFMPMVAALGGATGNQMVAMIVRGLAMGELRWHNVRWILLREITAVALGSLIIGSLFMMATVALKVTLMLGVIVCISILLNMVFATIVGVSIPLALRAMKLDPALGSSIIVAASTDVMGFFIFLGLAQAFLK